jgi:hypothetical protein
VFIPQIGGHCQTINLPAFRQVRRMKEPLPRDAPFHCIFPDRLAKGLAGDYFDLPVQVCAKLTSTPDLTQYVVTKSP